MQIELRRSFYLGPDAGRSNQRPDTNRDQFKQAKATLKTVFIEILKALEESE
jgi:hypothetical protein